MPRSATAASTHEAASEATVSAERLRELLLDLEQSQQRERALRAQSEALLAGVKALTEASTPDELFARVIEALRQPLSFDDAFVLRASHEPGTLVAAAATSPGLLGSRWTIGRAFERILQAGRVVIHFDTGLVGEWQAQPDEVRAAAGSAICIPLRGTSETALLVCTRRATRGFQPAQEQMARRFQPLATQALRDAERVAQIERANHDMRLVLDSVDQGLLTIDREGRIVGETSGAVHAWFGAVEPGTSFCSVIARISANDAEMFDVGWQQIIDGVLPLDLAIELTLNRICTTGRTLALQLRPVGDPRTWTRMLVVISDITAVLGRERAEERVRELAALVTHVVRDRAGFQTFWDESVATVDELVTGRQPDRVTQLRRLHTLKGNTASMGLGSIARTCHALEERAREHALTVEDLDELAERWGSLAAEIAPVLGTPLPPIAISEEEHRWLMDELRRSGTPFHIATTVGSWAEERVEVPFGRLAEQARQLAERLDKPDLDVRIEPHGVRVGSRYRPFFSALGHAVRNALDHGVELPEEREAGGKPRAGRMSLRAETADDGLRISVEDDGRGIDWQKVAEKASTLGLRHDSHADLVQALLADGLSTRSEVTDVSGRGVGLSALCAAVQTLGGRIDIESALGRGTILRCTFPR